MTRSLAALFASLALVSSPLTAPTTETAPVPDEVAAASEGFDFCHFFPFLPPCR